jgi:hypothetical protein
VQRKNFSTITGTNEFKNAKNCADKLQYVPLEKFAKTGVENNK